jgi:hypothetical protein
MGRQDAAELDALLQFAGRKHVSDEQARVARALGATGPGLEAYAGIIDAAGRDIGVPIDRTTVDGRLLARTVLRGYKTLLHELTEAVADIPRQAQAAVAKPVLPTFSFFAHWDEFIATKKSNQKWKRDTASGAEATPRLFKALIGKLPFARRRTLLPFQRAGHHPADVAGVVEHVMIIVRPGVHDLPTNGSQREAFSRVGPNFALLLVSRGPMPRSDTIRRRP